MTELDSKNSLRQQAASRSQTIDEAIRTLSAISQSCAAELNGAVEKMSGCTEKIENAAKSAAEILSVMASTISQLSAPVPPARPSRLLIPLLCTNLLLLLSMTTGLAIAWNRSSRCSTKISATALPPSPAAITPTQPSQSEELVRLAAENKSLRDQLATAKLQGADEAMVWKQVLPRLRVLSTDQLWIRLDETVRRPDGTWGRFGKVTE